MRLKTDTTDGSMIRCAPCRRQRMRKARFVTPAIGASGTVQILAFLMLNIMLAQSMNLLTGIAGQISLEEFNEFARWAVEWTAARLPAWQIEYLAALPFAHRAPGGE